MSGRVVERKVELGAIVGRDSLETELFSIADLDRVWVELAVSPEDAPRVRKGQTVSVTTRGITEKAEGRVIFISPMLDKNTHSARVVAEIDNNDGVWRPGSFVTAAIAFEEKSIPLAVPIGGISDAWTADRSHSFGQPTGFKDVRSSSARATIVPSRWCRAFTSARRSQ